MPAIIDLGTNTFQLLIARTNASGYEILHDESRVAKIGLGGISEGVITAEGIGRAVQALQYFRSITDAHGIAPQDIMAIGTSAIRNAKNQAEFCEAVLKETGITVTIIQGHEEAQLIYEGVRLGTPLGMYISLITDIGGGSVEFILCNEKRIFWKQSFEIGGQRLMDKFFTADPIPPAQVHRLYAYLDEVLLPLTNAIHQYQPETLVGSAGSFETLADMYWVQIFGQMPPKQQIWCELPQDSFGHSYRQLLQANAAERRLLGGMKEFRADMIVVGVCLIDFLLKKHSIPHIKVSNYALKEGVLARSLNLNA